MKTKHIFYSVALAATMVACSQEELTIPASNTQDLSNRPVLGDVTLVDGSAETRFSTGTGAQPVFENGDKVGAAIIDVVSDATNADPASRYTIAEYYSSNSVFTRVDGAWKLNADMPLVEGNYLFYAPYNAAMNTRAPLTIKVPARQDASGEKTALDEFYRSGAVVRVGYKFLAAENGVAQKPSLTLNDVFAYPVFTVKNNFNGYLYGKDGSHTAYSGEIKVDSIALRMVDGSGVVLQTVAIGGKLQHGTATVPASVSSGVVGMMKAGAKWSTTPMENYTSDVLVSASVKNDATGFKDRTPGNITTLVAGRTVAASGVEKFYGVMPALKINGSTEILQAVVYTTINGKNYAMGTSTLAITSGSVSSWGTPAQGLNFSSAVNTINLIKGQKYPQEELNFEDGALSAKSSAGSILTLNLTGGKAAGSVQVAIEVTPDAAPTVIANNAQFINFFKEQLNGSALKEKASGSNTGTQFVFAANTTASINTELIDALSKYNNKGSLQIDKALVIDNNVKITNIGSAVTGYTPVTFESENGNSYTINLKTTTGGYSEVSGVLTSNDGVNNLSIHVSSSASAHTISVNTTVGNLRNDGDITLNAFTLTPTEFVNNGTLTVKGTVANTVENNGDVKIDAATASITVNAGTGTIYLPKAYAAANVTVAGGNQTGIYAAAFDKTEVEAAEAIVWINAFEANGGSLTTAAFNAEVLEKMVDIKTVYATGATFPAGSFDMTGKTLVVKGTLSGLNGNGMATTIVSNINIVNETNSDLTLTNIAASGVYSKASGATGKIKANGTSATWNGGEAK